MILEQKEPLIHRIHSMLCENLKLFFACYVKFESHMSVDPEGLKSMDAENNVRKLKTLYVLYVGDKAEKLAKSLMKNKILKHIVLDFYKTTKKAYIQAGKYLQQKYPIENSLLESLAGLDPNIKSFFEHFISKESPSDLAAELRNYLVDSDLPQLQNSEHLNVWWIKVFEMKWYPMLSSKVRASLSIFTGPMVESLSSMMNNITDLRSGRTEIHTYGDIMTVKYQLKSAGMTASSKFHRKDILRDPVYKNLCHYRRTSCSQCKKGVSTKRGAILKQQRILTTKKNPKIKGARKRRKVHKKVTLKSAFHFGNYFFRQS